MYIPPSIGLGSLSAENDLQFRDHFVETKYYKRIESFESDIVYGAKGIGKTALRKALTELHGHKFYKTATIDLDAISFEAVYDKLSHLNSTIKSELHVLSRATWMNTLICYGLNAYSDTLPSNDLLRIEIKKILSDDGFFLHKNIDKTSTSNYRLLNMIENIFRKISSFTVEEAKIQVSLTPAQQDIINQFPINEGVSSILVKVIEELSKTAKKILICIDGFDSIVKHDEASREAIFAGLIDSVYRFHKNSSISSVFCFKAFLPLELTAEAKVITSDSDKYTDRVHYLSWDNDDFKNFIAKRLYPFSKRRSSKFTDIWPDFMPEKVFNNSHSVEENTFDYILRHTLYRPRQVLDHIQNIFKLWGETPNSSDKVQPSFIPQAIAKRNKLMASLIAEYLSNIYKPMINFLKSWQGSPTIFEARKFKDKLVRYFSNSDSSFIDTDKLFDDFFNLGIFGVQASGTMDSVERTINFRFAFVGDNIDSHITNSVEDTDYIAFAPIFREYCNCKSSDGIIKPVPVDEY